MQVRCTFEHVDCGWVKHYTTVEIGRMRWETSENDLMEWC